MHKFISFCYKARFWETDGQIDRRRERPRKTRALHCIQSHCQKRNIGWFCWRFWVRWGEWICNDTYSTPVDWSTCLLADLPVYRSIRNHCRYRINEAASSTAVAMETSSMISRGSFGWFDSICCESDVCHDCESDGRHDCASVALLSYLQLHLIFADFVRRSIHPRSTANIYANGRYGRMHTCM